VLTSSPYVTLLSSKLPIGGGISSVLQLPSGGLLDGCLISIPVFLNGNFHGFTQYTVDSSWPSGFGNGSDSAGVAEPQIPAGASFFFENTLGTPENWIQNY
jgi:hypothetical protein